MNGNWNGVRVSDAFGSEEVRIGYVDGWLTTSQNMVKIFFILSLVIAIMTAPVFCGEYGGVDNIILTSRYGRTKCGAAKVGAGFDCCIYSDTGSSCRQYFVCICSIWKRWIELQRSFCAYAI
ncbi:hypothetical protein [Sporofaciens musculi]|uniref:hypothetical protein n=1 Tax=Sporofaciens musculi TaxID=2681861 RepID=UPI001FCB2BC1|nr:hypothetical protein [Sporofaciens musculi]